VVEQTLCFGIHHRLPGRGKIRRNQGKLRSTQGDAIHLRRAAAEFNEEMHQTRSALTTIAAALAADLQC
jgi:hypothetical protein